MFPRAPDRLGARRPATENRQHQSKTRKPTTGPLRSPRTRGERAFSLFELVVVVFLIGIIALLALPSFHQSLLESEVDRAAAEVQTLARYARSRALTGSPHDVVFDPAGGTVTVWDTVNLAPAPDPLRKGHDCVLRLGGGGKFPHVYLTTADFAGAQRVSFDRLGNATSSGRVVLSGGDFTRTVRVAGPGGRVTVE